MVQRDCWGCPPRIIVLSDNDKAVHGGKKMSAMQRCLRSIFSRQKKSRIVEKKPEKRAKIEWVRVTKPIQPLARAKALAPPTYPGFLGNFLRFAALGLWAKLRGGAAETRSLLSRHVVELRRRRPPPAVAPLDELQRVVQLVHRVGGAVHVGPRHGVCSRMRSAVSDRRGPSHARCRSRSSAPRSPSGSPPAGASRTCEG